MMPTVLIPERIEYMKLKKAVPFLILFAVGALVVFAIKTENDKRLEEEQVIIQQLCDDVTALVKTHSLKDVSVTIERDNSDKKTYHAVVESSNFGKMRRDLMLEIARDVFNTYDIMPVYITDGNTYEIDLDDGAIYEDGECIFNLSAARESISAQMQEAERTSQALKITGVKLSKKGDYLYVDATLKNPGNMSYSFVKVKATYYDSDGNVITTDWTYAVDSVAIEPGENKQFDVITSSSKASEIRTVKLSIIDYSAD